MGRTAATARAVVVATVAVGALLLGGRESVGTWTPASKGGPTPAAASSATGASPSATWSPAAAPTDTPTPSSSPGVSLEPVAEPDGIRDAHPDGEADPDDETDAVADGEAATTLVRGDSGPRSCSCRDASVSWATGSASRRVVRVAHPAGGLRAPEVGRPAPRRCRRAADQRALEAGIRPGVTLAGDGVEIVLDRQILVVVRRPGPHDPQHLDRQR